MRLRRDAGTGHVGRLAVVPDARGRGLGAALLGAAGAAARGAGAARLELFTGAASSADPALHRRCGCAPGGTRPDPPGPRGPCAGARPRRAATT
ncbi:GNAT family N-acetyltransferase [Quadrisphaera sp. DSM 44207]|uniref:GNAT family N-acetyltransferase n=1 Tax=Quadrisphaera sp. DSM 44207 TaxID=1881057 RepID=UPI00088C7236|nr:Acetyltransferase (GNAT) family protein [Quadrisphaera sp. DSM 44207]